MVCYGDVDASGKDALGNEFMIPSEKVFLFYFLPQVDDPHREGQ
jgi:hypothetical protein